MAVDQECKGSEVIEVKRVPDEFTYRWMLSAIEEAYRAVWAFRERTASLSPAPRPLHALRSAARAACQACAAIESQNGHPSGPAGTGLDYKDALADCAIMLLTAWGPLSRPALNNLPVPTVQDLMRMSRQLGDRDTDFSKHADYLLYVVAGGVVQSLGSDPFYRQNHIVPALGVVLLDLGKALPQRIRGRLPVLESRPTQYN